MNIRHYHNDIANDDADIAVVHVSYIDHLIQPDH